MEDRIHRLLLVALVGIGLSMPGAGAAGVSADAAAVTSQDCVFDHLMLRTAATECRPRARSYPRNVTGSVQHAIYDSALTFGVPYSVLLEIARCESGLNPRARHTGHLGLFQFLLQTFRGGASAMRRETGVSARTPWTALDASYVAGYLFARGAAHNWSCANLAGTGLPAQ